MISPIIFNEQSRLLTASANLSVEKLEKYANQKGLTLGYEPAKKIAGNTLGDILDRRVPNRLQSSYGEIDDLCVGLKARIQGREWTSRNVPRSATGPDLKKILIGARGRFGKILEVTLRVFPRPETRRTVTIRWSKAQPMEEFFRRIGSAGIRFALLNENPRSVRILLEGTAASVQTRIKALKEIVTITGGRLPS